MSDPHLFSLRRDALDAIDPDNTDEIRELWTAFAGAKNFVRDGKRLEYLLWRLYSRGLTSAKRRDYSSSNAAAHARGSPSHFGSSISLSDVPDLESSLSSDSIDSTRAKRITPQSLDDLFVPLVRVQKNIPARHQGLTSLNTERLSVSRSPIEVCVEQSMDKKDGRYDEPVKEVEEARSIPKVAGTSASAESGVVGSSVVRGFAPGSVSVGPSSAALRAFYHQHPELRTAERPSPANGRILPEPRSKMFFIESSSDSESGSAGSSKVTENIASDAPRLVTPRGPSNPPLLKSSMRHTTSTDKSSNTVNFAVSDSNGDAADSTEDEWEDDLGSDDEWDDVDDDDANSGDGNDDGNNERGRSFFSERDVPLKPQLRPSLLSSLFLNQLSEHNSPMQSDAEEHHAAPRKLSSRRNSSKRSLFIEDFLSEASPQPGAVSETAPVGSDSDAQTHVPIDLLLHAPVRDHIPYRKHSNGGATYAHDLEEVRERELSQSVRENLLASRGFDLESLWPAGTREHSKSTSPSSTPRRRRRSSSASRSGSRPPLSRSSTTPASSFRTANSNSLAVDPDIYDTMSYHARGW